eukprot:c16137_g1_i1 orf=688-1866(-)
MAAKLLRRSFWYWDRLQSSADGHLGEDEEEVASSRSGIVVVLGWMLSRRRNLAPYTRLYKSRGWDCLVCHPQVFNLFIPSWATTLALSVLEELAKELQRRPCPVVFAVFSGGHKSCLYKIIQILMGKCSEVSVDEEERFAVVMRSLSGLIFDSSPVDFVTHLGAKFVSHQVLTLQPGRPIGFISWVAYAVGRGVDVVFSRQLGPQRIDLWQALYSSVKMGPILFLCSENDKMAPVETIQIFASNLRKLGGKVDMVVWKESEHVGHFRLYPEQYSSEVVKLLTTASSVYYDRFPKGASESSTASVIASIGSVHDLGLALDTISATWTDLPESITSEISRVSRLPHVHVKKGHTGDERNVSVFHGVELQTCSKSLDVVGDTLMAGHILGLRSRL